MTSGAPASGAPVSGVLVGDLRHRRHHPGQHRFDYEVWHLLVDVDELPLLDERVAGFGWNRPALVSLHDTDHLGPLDLPLRTKLRRFLAGHGVALPPGRVLLQASPRVLGHTFNPVAWWWCHDATGELALVVAEVRNTFGDTHCYVLQDLARPGGGHDVVAHDTKVFHVSPFLPVAPLDYAFTFRPPSVPGVPGERVVVHMDVTDGPVRVLDATTAQQREPLTTASLRRQLLRMPWMTGKTVAAIHWQALFIWRRKADFHRRPEPPPTGYDAVAQPERWPAVG